MPDERSKSGLAAVYYLLPAEHSANASPTQGPKSLDWTLETMTQTHFYPTCSRLGAQLLPILAPALVYQPLPSFLSETFSATSSKKLYERLV